MHAGLFFMGILVLFVFACSGASFTWFDLCILMVEHSLPLEQMLSTQTVWDYDIGHMDSWLETSGITDCAIWDDVDWRQDQCRQLAIGRQRIRFQNGSL